MAVVPHDREGVMALSIGYETISQWKESRGYFIDTEVFFPRGPRQMVLDLEPMHALLKSGADVTVGIITGDDRGPGERPGDYACMATWVRDNGEVEVWRTASMLDAAVRDACVEAISLGLVK